MFRTSTQGEVVLSLYVNVGLIKQYDTHYVVYEKIERVTSLSIS